MSRQRTIQHITWRDRVEVAKVEGQKVESLCGKFVYPMTRMKDEIPTCTPCVNVMRKQLNRGFVWTATSGTVRTWSA